MPLLFLLACAIAPPKDDGPPGDTARDTPPPHTGATDTGGTDTGGTDTGGTDTAPVLPTVHGVEPHVADPEGGGGRVVVTLDTTAGVVGVALGGVPLTDFAVDDATRVSGVPGAHPAGVVELTVTTAAGATVGAGPVFEYWSPRQLPGLDAYVDAAHGVTDAGGVSAWTDLGPNARGFVQADPARRPAWVPGAFGELPAVRFTPDEHLRLPSAVALEPTGSTVFAVARWTATTDVVPPPGNAGNVPLTLVGDGTSAYGAFGASGGGVASTHYVGGHVTAVRGEGLNDGVARLVGASVDRTTVVRLFVGATQQGLDTNSAPLLGLHSYDTIGAGWPGADGWDGDVGAVVVVAGAVSREDRLRLDEWAQQRFGTPDTPPIDDWERVRLGELPEAWHPRDGAQAVELGSGRVLAIGGWSPYDPWDGSRTTNEVWASDDRGATWSLLLPHDPDPPETGAGARFPPGHTVGVTTWQGRAVVIGTDPNDPPYGGEVWVEGDDGATWTRVSTTAPTAGRCLFLVGSLGDDLYVMGGQTDPTDAGTGLADVWRSTDGGVTWEELGAPPWSPRGMVYRPVEHDGRLYVVGGGLYDLAAPVAWDGVYAFDGTTWTTVLPDGHGAFAASYYHALAVADGRLWLFNGFTGTEELNRALYSDDGGHTWAELPGGAGGEASHADTAVGLAGRVLRVSGNLSERAVYAFEAGG